jgi:hypothetical protein
MGKDDDLVKRAAAAAFSKAGQEFKVAAPINDVQIVAMVAASVYPACLREAYREEGFDPGPKGVEGTAVEIATEIVAQAGAVVTSGELVKRMQRYIEERKQADSKPTLVPN